MSLPLAAPRPGKWWAGAALLCLPPALIGPLARLAFGDALQWVDVALGFAFVLFVAFLGGAFAPLRVERSARWSFLTPVLAAVGLAGLLVLTIREVNALSWLAVGALWAALLHVALSSRLNGRLAALGGLLTALVLAGLAGFIPVAALQWHERFSGEEAFAILQAGLLALVFLLLLLPARLIARRAAFRIGPSFPLRRRWAGLALAALTAILALRTLSLYQASFYDHAPPTYPGITEESPFLCLPGEPSAQVYDGKAVFDRLMANVAANPNQRAPEYGMLALATGDHSWAEQFRALLLKEAGAGQFTGPSNSVKYTQYEASLRAYYLPRVIEKFPGLLSADEEQALRDWFAAINRRALTVEWSDWVYAAALGIRPTGLYENQENGAGLLANLVAGGLADPALSTRNRAYLAANIRGWATRFRNTDDTIVYQPEWINNALFQSLAGQPVDERRKALAFEWLLLQTLPSGQTPPYNYPTQPSLAGIAYLAALEQRDPRYVWLAGRALEYAEATGKSIFDRPGVTMPVDLQGVSPNVGSCLLYGDSGLPTRGGPLAPDKVALRSGWNPDDAYALINLRFTGWHRYKATNTLPVIAFGRPVVGDQPGREAFRWLPTGRSLFRDKRIRREDLNGLLIPARGLAPVVRALSGIGTEWAQDPPWHAQVRRFGPEGEWDMAETVISDWHDWEHTRTTYLHHEGQIVVVVDDAAGPAPDTPQLIWHLEGGPWTPDADARSAQTGEGSAARRVVTLPVGRSELDWQFVSGEAGRAELRQTSKAGGALSVATVFLAGDATAADVKIERAGQEERLIIQFGVESVELPLPSTTR